MSYVLTICYPAVQASVTLTEAARISLALGCPLRVAHGYNIPYVIGEFPVPVIAPDDQRQLASSQLEAAVAGLRQQFPDLRIESVLSYGIPADVLAEAVEKERPLLVVLGNDEAADGDRWIGADTAAIMAEIDAPVLALSSATPFAPSHICLAVDDKHLAEGAELGGLDQLQRALRFRISVLTVAAETDVPQAGGGSPLMKQLEGAGASFHRMPASGNDPGSQIVAAAQELGADCLAVLKHDRGFWNDLFHRSQTAIILRETAFPVLALHENRSSS